MAHSFRHDPEFRARVEALLTAGADTDTCATYFGTHPDVMELYKAVFYDLDPVEGFGSRLAVVTRSSPFGSQGYRYKDVALKYGLQVLRWRLGEPLKISEEELEGLYGRIQQGLAFKLQMLEELSPSDKKYPSLLKALDSAVKMMEAMRRIKRGETEESLIDMIKKNLSTGMENCFDRDKVLASRAQSEVSEDEQ